MKTRVKSGKLIASVLLLLAGFSAGVGVNYAPLNTVVRGAPGDPNPALKRVEHDATLAGDGTSSAPLGVANGGVSTPQLANGAVTTRKIANGAVTTGAIASGAVTASKLSAVAPPSEGQLLGFNGANLAWQNAPIGGVRVVDSRGHELGVFAPPRVPCGVSRGIPFCFPRTLMGLRTGNNTVFGTRALIAWVHDISMRIRPAWSDAARHT